MIRHAIYSKHFVFIILYYSGDVLVKPFFPFRINQCLSEFYSNNYLDMNLSVCVCHFVTCVTTICKKQAHVLPRLSKILLTSFAPLGQGDDFWAHRLPTCSPSGASKDTTEAERIFYPYLSRMLGEKHEKDRLWPNLRLPFIVPGRRIRKYNL